MSCPSPIDAAVLADYWLGALGATAEAEVEEHLFTCDECGVRLSEVMALANGVRQLAREGSLMMVVSEAFVKRAEEEGLRVRQYAPIPAGGRLECTVAADDDLLVGRMAADLSGARRVDLCICDARGLEKMRMADIPVHAGANSVIIQQSITYAKAAPSEVMIARLVAFDETDRERLVGEYVFNHTRTIPGPAAW